MKFRPCIDIHNGKVRQIVGGSLADAGNQAEVNFSSEYDAAYYAGRYRDDGLCGGHMILLNPAGSEYDRQNRQQAMKALQTYPKGLQIGGGITAENGAEYIDVGASHVIVTSYLFQDGRIRWDHLERLKQAVGPEHIVIDLSCRKRGESYYIVTNRWQKFTDVRLTANVLQEFSGHCDEFLVHGVDAEGKSSGVELPLVRLLSGWQGIPITYAGGIGSMADLQMFEQESGGKLDFTIGSALDLFGGTIPYETVKNL